MVNSLKINNVFVVVFVILNSFQSILGQMDPGNGIVQNAYLNPQSNGGYGGGFNNQFLPGEFPPGGGFGGNYGVYPVISCPNIFSYQSDPNMGGIYGEVRTPKSRFDSEFDLEVNMTINRAVAQSDNIKLNVLSTQDEIFHGELIRWSIRFPYQDILPKLTQIKFNGMVICSNQPDPLVSGITQTSMWAKAVIRTSASGTSSQPEPPMIPSGPIYGPGQPYPGPYYPPSAPQQGGVIVQT